MRMAGRMLVAATLLTASGSMTWSTDKVDDRWADKVLSDPRYDEGWDQPCDNDWNDGKASYCEVRELPYQTDGHSLGIDGGENGGMTVMGWDKNTIRVIYRVRARGESEAQAKELASHVRLTSGGHWIKPDGPASTRDAWWSVEMKVWVPRETNLSLRTLNGPAGVRGVKGTMEVRTTNGPLALVEVAGAVLARAQNGPLHVALEGARWSGAGLDAESQNGPVNLILPRNYSAQLETGTVNGPSAISYPIAIEGRIRGQFTTKLGSGGPPVRVTTENGPFHFAVAGDR